MTFAGVCQNFIFLPDMSVTDLKKSNYFPYGLIINKYILFRIFKVGREEKYTLCANVCILFLLLLHNPLRKHYCL